MNNRIYYSHEAEQQVRREKLVLTMLVAGLSISIGAAIALIFAPQAGEKTRKQIGKQMEENLTKGLYTTTDGIREQVQEQASQVRDTINDRIQKIKE